MPRLDTNTKADVYLLVVSILAALGWVFSKEALQGLPPLFFIGSRFLIAGLVLAFYSRKSLQRLTGQQARRAILLGGLFGTGIAIWIHGLYYNRHVGEGAFLTSTSIVLIPIIAFLFFKEKVPLSTWMSLPMALCGLMFLSFKDSFSLANGHAFYLLSAVLFALHFNLVNRYVSHIGALPLTAIQLSMVGMICLTLSLTTETWPRLTAVPTDIIFWVLCAALLSTSLRFFLQTYAQQLSPASHSAIILTLEPLWTAIIAAFWFDERMSTYQLIGCSCIFTAIMMSRWRWILALFRSVGNSNHTPS